MANGVQITGLAELQARMKAAPKNISKLISFRLYEGAQAIAAEAKQRAPGDVGILRNEINAAKVDDLNFEAFSGADYSAYVEFGTGTKVEIPAGLEEYAAQFQGAGAGDTGAKEAIFAWCERKGIDKLAWYPIYISIMTNGISPQPFFFPAVRHQEPSIIDNVKKALATAI